MMWRRPAKAQARSRRIRAAVAGRRRFVEFKTALTLFADKAGVFHASHQWPVAGPVQLAPAAGRYPPAGFGRWRRLELVVDLGEDLFSARWWRGLATLGALCGSAAAFAPGLQPLPTAVHDLSDPAQAQALAIAPLGLGSRTGQRMAAGPAVEPIAFAPERPWLEFEARLAPGDSVGRLLARSGAAYGDSAAVEALVRDVAGRIPPGTAVEVRLGAKSAGTRPVERVELRPGIALRIVIRRSGAGLGVERQPLPVDRTPLRIRGRAGDGLYWALRAAGASPATAADYLQALAREIDVGEIGPDDRFDLVLANARSATGESRGGPLLYAGLERSSGRSLQLVRWPVGGQPRWVDAASFGSGGEPGAMAWPVAGRVTSAFGYRVHPILRFSRFHSGVDFGASWGAPIVASADGQVVRAGWAGGYGRQVRIAHGGDLVSSYSHMSRIVAAAGTMVRRGEVIGYVGSSGLSTGPHLHYEVRQGGRAINPLSVRLSSAPPVDAGEVAAFKARLRELLNVGVKRG